MNGETSKTCCFIGHREINETDDLIFQLNSTIKQLITEKKVNTFLFGSKSRFNSLCYEQVTKLKEKHPDIIRVYVRAEFPDIDDSYKKYLLARYEETYFPETILRAGKSVYVKRNQEMIDKREFCIFYYIEDYSPENRKSGTKTAVDYALRKNKKTIIFS